jgi:hypothetical protein
LDDRRVVVRFPGGTRELLFSETSRAALWPTQPGLQWVSSVSFPRVKRPGCEDDRSRPSSGEYKNEWSYTSTPYGVMQYKRAVTVNVMSVSNCVPQSELSVGFL